MMSLIDLEDDQRWVPTHVNVTAQCARGLRTKSKHGSRYLYTIIQLGKEKYTTGLVDKAEVPQWNEECCFELLPGILEDEGRSSYPPGSGDLVLTVMHRVLIGLDVFLGQTIIPLDKIFHEGTCPRDEWFKLHSKVGRKEKERGELQVTVQFTRNNMTASMFDLTMKDKPRSTFGKLKDRVTGRKRGDLESSSAIVPGRYAALSASTGQPFEVDMAGAAREVEVSEEKRNKMKDFFKGKLRKSSDTRSCSSLASDSSLSSMASDNPPPSLDLLSDPPSSPIYTSKVRVEPQYGEADLARKVLTSQHTTKVLTHKRALSDEASKITTAVPRSVESLKGQTMTQSKSSLCINGSHVYDSEPSTPKISGALPSKLVLLEKCAPLSRSLQNLTKKTDEKSLFSEGRRWSFDKTKKDAQDEDKESSPPSQKSPLQATTVSSASASPEKGRKFRKTLFSGGRSDSLPAKSESLHATPSSEGRLRGWFSSSDSQSKPRLEVSPKVESSSDLPPPLPVRSPVPPLPPVFLVGDQGNPFTTPPSSSPSSTPLSPSNPFFSHLQQNPFFEELIETQSPPFTPSTDSSPFRCTTVPSQDIKSFSCYEAAVITSSIKRERPKLVPRQTSLPALLPKAYYSSDPSGPHSLSESAEEWEESFDVFASSRVRSPKANTENRSSIHELEYVKTVHTQNFQSAEPPPLPPRKPSQLRTPVNEIYSDGWLHRGQELAVHKEAYLLSQTGMASLQHVKDTQECKNNLPGVPKDFQLTSNKTSKFHPSKCATSPEFATEEKLKYAPLQDDFDCWGGMLFEEDLYSRMCTGKYVPTGVNSHLSIRSEILAAEKKTSGSTKPLGSEMPVEDLLQMPPNISKIDLPLIESSPPLAIKTLECPLTPLETCLNNNISFSLTLGDLNMNNSDFGFIDSDASSHSDIIDCYKGQSGLGRTLQASKLESERTTPEEVFHLKDTYIPEINSSFEISTNTLSNISSIGVDTCQDCISEFQNSALNGNASKETSKETMTPEVERKLDSFGNNLHKTQTSTDSNANLQGMVVSARLRPKGQSNANSNSNSPLKQNKHGDGEFEQFLSLVQNISQEGPLSYQPSKSALVTMRALDKHIDLLVNNIKKSGQKSVVEAPIENILVKKDPLMSFEDLHAKVAPASKTSSRISSELSLSIPSALLLTSDHQAKLCPPSVRDPSSDTLVFGPPHEVFTNTSCTICTSDQSLVDAHQSLLPEEIQPASNLPHQESRTHPVKPLTSSQSEKKEGRSVLEMLKSTISPGRATQLATADPEKAPEVKVDMSQYQDMTNMELISLLLQQEMDMQKQQSASERQMAQLEKCEAELKKVKAQVRDLEDYIDNLLLRIMEQTPTLLQVRSRHK